MNKELHIRRAVPADKPVLEELMRRSFKTLAQGYYSVTQIEKALGYIAGIDDDLIEGGTFFIAEIAGQTAGCGAWSRRGEFVPKTVA